MNKSSQDVAHDASMQFKRELLHHNDVTWCDIAIDAALLLAFVSVMFFMLQVGDLFGM